MAKLFANSRDPDQTPHSATSDLALHCLPVILLWVSQLQWAVAIWLKKVESDVKPKSNKQLQWVKWSCHLNQTWDQCNVHCTYQINISLQKHMMWTFSFEAHKLPEMFAGFQVALKFLKNPIFFLSLPKISKKLLKKVQIPTKAFIFHKHP